MKQIIRERNGKLYNVTDHQYVLLFQIVDFIKDGFEVVVIDRRTKADITSKILTRCLFGYEANNNSYMSADKLRKLIKHVNPEESIFETIKDIF